MLLTLPELIADARSRLRCVSAESAVAEIQKTGGTIVDVRELVEVESLETPNTIHIPRGILEMKITGVVTEEDHPIYLHCATGGRATLAAEQLLRLGYTNVTVITCAAQVVQQKLQPLGGS